MRLLAFQGTRYRQEAGPDIGRLAAPPFDQIAAPLRDQLHGIPHHFSLLTRPAAREAATAVAEAANLHADWLGAGVVARDERPALYLNEIRLADGGRRRSIVGLVEIAPGAVRPHERTVDKTITERLNLLRATRIDLEPIMLFCDEPGALEESLAEDADGAEPLVEHLDSDGHRHRLYRIEDRARIRHYQQTLEPVPGLIADGHHRYKTARLYAEEIGAEPGTPAGAKLVFLGSLRSAGITIDPIHRLIPATADLEGAASLVSSREELTVTGGAAVAAAVAAAPQPAVGILRPGANAEIWRLDVDAVRARDDARLPSLAVVLLHAGILPAAGIDENAATDGTIVYRSDAAALAEEVERTSSIGIVLPPMSGAAFADALDRMDLLPPKSTRFLPKLASGLVWCQHDCEVL